MKVQEPTVGPILGTTTGTSARVFLRGDYQQSDGAPRRCHGVVRIRRRAGTGAWTTRYVKLNPNFDLTGVLVLEGLSAATRYEYQAGWLYSDVDSDTLDVTSLLDWQGIATTEFTTASTSRTGKRSFVVGSCRYLLRLFGGTIFDSRGDKTFRSIVRQIDDGTRTDLLLMVGDQIYADDLSFLSPDKQVDEFNARYRDAFSQEHLGRLMARVPTYMTLDDHEIEDNWPAKADERDLVRKFPAAMHAYLTYQLSHSPMFGIRKGKLTGTPDNLWYTHADGCAEYFVTDTRTERRLEKGKTPRILSDEQMRALKRWLSDGSERVKFVASAVPFFAATSEDKWEGFVEQRDELLDHIVDNQIRRVVFLSGDVHASFSCELASSADPDFKIVSVVSSAFFWPYPHPARSDFQLTGKIKTGSDHEFTVRNASRVHPNDNFTRVTVDPRQLSVEFFERKGDRLGRPKVHRL